RQMLGLKPTNERRDVAPEPAKFMGIEDIGRELALAAFSLGSEEKTAEQVTVSLLPMIVSHLDRLEKAVVLFAMPLADWLASVKVGWDAGKNLWDQWKDKFGPPHW